MGQRWFKDTMADLPAYRCYTCHQLAGNPHTSLDRRVARRTGAGDSGDAAVTLSILSDQELFVYCDVPCWKAQEGSVAAELKLKTTYPPDEPLTPCGRCGAPVVRAFPHVLYALTTTKLTEAQETYIGEVLCDVDFAILCPTCEELDLPPAHSTQASLLDERENA